MDKMKIKKGITISYPEVYEEIIQYFINKGLYDSRSQFVQTAIKNLIKLEEKLYEVDFGVQTQTKTKN